MELNKYYWMFKTNTVTMEERIVEILFKTILTNTD